MKGCISLRYILIQYCFYFGRTIIHIAQSSTRYSAIDELTTEQPQQNHTQSSHLAAKLIIEYSTISYQSNACSRVRVGIGSGETESICVRFLTQRLSY